MTAVPFLDKSTIAAISALSVELGRCPGSAHRQGGDEVINLFAVAMRAGMPAADLRTMLFGYPTNASDLPYML